MEVTGKLLRWPPKNDTASPKKLAKKRSKLYSFPPCIFLYPVLAENDRVYPSLLVPKIEIIAYS